MSQGGWCKKKKRTKSVLWPIFERPLKKIGRERSREKAQLKQTYEKKCR